jgi:hypothetical protein
MVWGPSCTTGAISTKTIREGHVVTRLQIYNRTSDRFNHARPFVAQDDWKRNTIRGIDHREVCMADARGHHTYTNLISAGFLEFNLFDLKRLAVFPANSR